MMVMDSKDREEIDEALQGILICWLKETTTGDTLCDVVNQ